MFDRIKLVYLVLIPLSAASVLGQTHSSTAVAQNNCSPSYPDVCIAPPPPDLDCKDISYRNFRVVAPDPHRFDGNKNGIGCEE